MTAKDKIETTKQNIDWRILNWIKEKTHCNFLDFLMPKITALGSGGAVWLLFTFIFLCTKKYRIYGILIPVGLGVASFFGEFLLKHFVKRNRPCNINQDIFLLVKTPKDTSFPSNHTLTSVTSAMIILHASPVLGFISLAIALVIAFSRLYLYVHYPSDVFAAIILGIIFGEAVFYIASLFLSL